MLLSHPFTKACEMFVLAHEYGHVLAGHFDDEALRLEHLHTEVGHIEVIKKDWQQELEADTIAYKIILGVEEYNDIDLSVIDKPLEQEMPTGEDWANGLTLKCAIAAPFLFFTIDGIITEVKRRLNDQPVSIIFDSRHPSSQMRIGNLLPVLEGKNPRYTGYANYPGILVRAFDEICEKIEKALKTR